MTSQEFHDQYYDRMYDKLVRITLKNGKELIGLFNDEFYEENSILLSCQVIHIDDIYEMQLWKNETSACCKK